MDTRQLLAVTHREALQFFYEHLRDLPDRPATIPQNELLYNASVLAHFASTSTASADAFPPTPANLSTVLDVFVLDRSQHHDSEIMEAAASQCLVLTGFFADQMRHRHNIKWFASLGAGFYERAAAHESDRARSQMMAVMSGRFDFWRRQQRRLARELRDLPMLLLQRFAIDIGPGLN